MKNLLMIGLSKMVLAELETKNDLNVYVIEEKEIYDKNDFKDFKCPLLKKVMFGKYMQSDECVDIAVKLNEEVKIDGVFPGRDFAVRGTNLVAEKLGLPRIGYKNAEILTNKCLLREACAKYNIPHPRFKKINTLDELYDFYQGKPVIFKPATLQASLGISKINSKEDIEPAWNRTVNTNEKPNNIVSRNLIRENIAEEFIDGYEVSVETFVQHGKVVFMNITRKLSFDDTFVEKGHTAPSCLPDDIDKKIRAAKEHFVKALNIQDGVLHSEWKIENEEPVLVECAGRGPGDCINELINRSYGFNFYAEAAELAVGNTPAVNTKPTKVNAIMFFSAKQGTLKDITGLESLNNPAVVKWDISAKKGDTITSVESSWDRIGFFIVEADNFEEIQTISNKILDSVHFIVE